MEQATVNRRTVIGGALAAAAAPLLGQSAGKKRVATVGTGLRGSTTWGTELLKEHGDRIEFVGLCDINRKRAEASKRMTGVNARVYTDLAQMIRETKPEMLIVTTKDGLHHEMIIRGLEMGCQVFTEKPMTTDETKCQAILDAEKKSGKPITVGFNYRYSNTAQKLKVAPARQDHRADHVRRFPLVSRHQPRRRLLPPLARLPGELGHAVRPQGHPSLRPDQLVPGR